MTLTGMRLKIMKKMSYLAMAALVIQLFAGASQASEAGHKKTHGAAEHSGISLSNDLKTILNEEMDGIEGGMMKMIPAIAAGDWEIIARLAQKIKDSFILKQKLSQQQLEELHASLPADFIKIDMSFHETSEKLAHAARQQDGELVIFYFSRLQSKCVTCHAQYASERFPSFKSGGEKSDQH